MCVGATISIKAGARCNRERKYLYTDAIYRQSAATPPRHFCRLQGKYYNYVVGTTYYMTAAKAYIIYYIVAPFIILYIVHVMIRVYRELYIREFFDCHLSIRRALYIMFEGKS